MTDTATQSKVIISGASDDIITLDGSIRDEFYPSDGGYGYLHFDDGAVFKVGYAKVDGKGWTVESMGNVPGAVGVLDPQIDDDGTHYADRVEYVGNFKSVKCWGSPQGPTSDDIDHFFDCFNARDYDANKLREAMMILSD